MNRLSQFALSALLAATASASMAQKQTPLERGKYLMEGVVACGNCHLQRGPQGEPLFDKGLSGGMVFDERVYRRLPPGHRARIRASGGAMEFLTRRTHAMLTDAIAVFGHVGDPRAERVDLRAGYVHTPHSHVMVCWQRSLPTAEREALVARVAALGPF